MKVPVPFGVKSLKKALQAIARYLPGEEFPEKAILIIKKAGNPILVYDEASGQVVDLGKLLSVSFQVYDPVNDVYLTLTAPNGVLTLSQ